MNIWTCKIGEVNDALVPRGADAPMRDAVAAEYRALTGCEPAFTFSGWGGELTEGERAVVENRAPKTCEIDTLHQYRCTHCGIGYPTAALLEAGSPPGVTG